VTGLPGADGAAEPPGLAAVGPVDAVQVANLEMLTRALVGVTLQSLEVLSGEVSLPQFRLLLAAATLGRVPSSRLAAAAAVPASSVTRLADKLEAAGLLVRGADGRSRSIVTIEITASGRDLVARVVARRQALLAAVLARMAPADRAAVAQAAALFAELATDAADRAADGPLPL
jgi:DNA-binding MarR family transcriptional regulator